TRTSRRLGLRSEASARFEKGADPGVIDLAADRFCDLAADICGAEIADLHLDVRGELPERPPAALRTARVTAVLGPDLSTPEMAGILDRIGFSNEETPVGLTVAIT